MNKTLMLTRILLKNGGGQFKRFGKKKRRLPLHIILPVLLLIALMPLMYAFASMVSSVYDSLKSMGQEGVIPGLGLATTSAVIFMFGIFYIINVFYFSQDVEYLLPLPLKPVQILTAKFIVTLLYEYLTQLVLLLPVLLIFGIKNDSGIAYYIYSGIIFLVLPIIPLVLASIVAMVMMSFSSISRSKDRFRMFAGITAVLLSVGGNILFQRTMNNSLDPSKLQDMFQGGHNSFVELATRAFPSVKLAADALLRETTFAGLMNLVLFLSLSALFFIGFAFLGQGLYFKGVIGISESSARRKQISGARFDKLTAQQPVLKAYLLKELRILFRTPPYFLNCVLMSFMWPVLLLIPVLTQPNFMESLRAAESLFKQDGMAALVLGGGASVFLFISGANYTASTSISREGAGFFVNKYLPVAYDKMIRAKLLAGWLLTLSSMLLIIMFAYVLLHLPPGLVLLFLLIGIPATLFCCLTGVLIDLLMPKLQWDNEQKAVKQNMNGLYNMLIGLVFAGLVFLLVLKLDCGLFWTAIVLLVVLIGADALLYRLLMAKGEKWYLKIEA
ncbi:MULTISPECIES: hypothetical protein [unclassified Paenibacillus]|uniref:putative ABC transporter permease subunit n=1 Tax=unclassified Paenibacillus TaxID=185978 RepID=UPI001AE4B62F|nr:MULTISPECIES: hypothetical protein [unclassified Paenibacillus]MBP1157520.1 ABC-2 type transport system permease protein [Paenibacillus sp. PvP091]MBP1171743.1 ABC-2 type transport system permease protein [Paenibacillus sp. PvR098]MBP2438124.1 ABC-2 type transport system permease protein [Paenibacillus sp. PvP052]